MSQSSVAELARGRSDTAPDPGRAVARRRMGEAAGRIGASLVHLAGELHALHERSCARLPARHFADLARLARDATRLGRTLEGAADEPDIMRAAARQVTLQLSRSRPEEAPGLAASLAADLLDEAGGTLADEHLRLARLAALDAESHAMLGCARDEAVWLARRARGLAREAERVAAGGEPDALAQVQRLHVARRHLARSLQAAAIHPPARQLAEGDAEASLLTLGVQVGLERPQRALSSSTVHLPAAVQDLAAEALPQAS